MTGTLAVYTLIISFGICICTPETQEAEQHHFEKETQISQTNEPQKTNIFNRKVRSGTELKQKKNTQTQHYNHNTKIN